MNRTWCLEVTAKEIAGLPDFPQKGQSQIKKILFWRLNEIPLRYIGKMIGVSGERVRQLENIGLNLIKKSRKRLESELK